MSIKMIVSDLDGTIINSFKESEISQKLVKEIYEFKKKGKIFTIATGRPQETSRAVIKKLGINSPFIVCNGAQIIDKGGTQIYSNNFSLKLWLPFLDNLQAMGASVIFTYAGQVLCLKHTKNVLLYQKKEQISCQVADKILLDSEVTVNKILVIGDVQKYLEYWHEIGDAFKREFRYLVSEDNYLEILSKGVSKGSALKRLKKYLGIKDTEVVTIGNHLNDKELIEEAHIGVAVANAVEELKSIADFVTTGEYEEGVIEILKKFS